METQMNMPKDPKQFSFVTAPRRMPGPGKETELDKAYFAISKLEIDEETKAGYKQKAKKYFNECGCSLSAFFFIAALAFSICYWLFFSKSFLPSWASILFIFSAAILGKLIGIGIGRIKLFVLVKKLSTADCSHSPHLKGMK
jgi:hypothetical protein